MREIGFYFLPSVCIRLLLIFADSILQLFHVVGFYGRIDFLSFFLDPRSMLFPDFPLSAVRSTANILIKSKLNPLCGQTNRANLALMTLCDNFIFPWRWIWLGWCRVVLLAVPQSCSQGCKGGLNCALNPSWFFVSSSIFCFWEFPTKALLVMELKLFITAYLMF